MTSVVHVTQPTTGGVARAVLGLARAQQADGLDVAVACPPGELPAKLAAAGVRWHRWDCTRQPGPGIPAERRALRDLLGGPAAGGRSPDLVHLHSSKAGLVGRLALRGRLRTVFQPHAWSFLAAEGQTRQAAITWERYATRWTDITLYCSRREQEDGVAHGIAAPGRVVLNGVDLRQFSAPGDGEQARARRALSIPPDAPVAAIVGRRCHQKGQDLAVAAWPLVRAEIPGAVLVLMGDGFPDGFDAGAGILTRGARDDVRPAFVAADLVLSPSRWEGLSLSLLEGMACARPTVAADVAGSREALLDGPLPAAGAVIPTEDISALATSVVARFGDPAQVGREGVAARQRVEADFDEGATTRSVHDVYRLLLGRSTG